MKEPEGLDAWIDQARRAGVSEHEINEVLAQNAKKLQTVGRNRREQNEALQSELEAMRQQVDKLTQSHARASREAVKSKMAPIAASLKAKLAAYAAAAAPVRPQATSQPRPQVPAPALGGRRTSTPGSTTVRVPVGISTSSPAWLKLTPAQRQAVLIRQANANTKPR